MSSSTLSVPEYAYLAGIIDADGSISMLINSRGYYQIKLGVSMTHKPTIEWLASTFGGPIHLEFPGSERHKPRWRWQVTSAIIREHLPNAIPYMITKRQVAELAMEALSYRRRGMGCSNEIRQNQIYQEIAILNKRGPADHARTAKAEFFAEIKS